jgi:hypothetical protein
MAESDILVGAAEISEWLLGSREERRRIYNLAETSEHRLPTFKIGGTLCARKSTILSWIAAQECAGCR